MANGTTAVLTSEQAGATSGPKRSSIGFKAWQQALLFGGAGWVLGMAEIYHRPAPFVPLFGMLLYTRRRSGFFALMAGGLVGLAVSGWWAALAVMIGWTFLVPVPWRLLKRPELAGVVVGIGGALLFDVGQRWSSDWALVTAVVGGGALFLYTAFDHELRRLQWWQADARTATLALISGACMIAGLARVHWGAFDLGLFLGGLVMVAAAFIDGAAGGAVAGATLGVTLALKGTSGASVGILVAGGFSAGWLSHLHWRLASLGLMAGVLVYAVFVHMPPHLVSFGVTLVISAAVVELVPEPWMDGARQGVRAWTAPKGPNLPERLHHIAQVMAEMARAFHVDDVTDTRETQVIQAILDAVCRKCSFYRSCWEDEFYRSYRGLLDLTARAEARLVFAQDLTGELARRCIRPEQLADATNLALHRERERASLTLRIRESRTLVQRQLEGLAELVDQLGRHFDRQAMHAVPKPGRLLPYQVGVAKRPRQGSGISGDSELVREISATQVVFGLSDGMGVGPRAAWESGTAIALLEQLLLAGFSQTVAVHAVNTTLLLRSVEEHFATLDLALVDRMDRGLELVKVAAAPSFIKRGERIEVIRSKSLPVGIVEQVQIEPTYHTIEPGDVLVMVTDGVFESDPQRSEDKVREMLRVLPTGSAQAMAETLLSYLLDHSGDGRDDATVLVAVFGPVKSHAVSVDHEGLRVTEWRRVTR